MARFMIASMALVFCCITNALAQNEGSYYTQPEPYEAVQDVYEAPGPADEFARAEKASTLQQPDLQLGQTMTPEMWLYLQEMRRYDDPKQAVRRKAEFRAMQRQNRMAATKWFGQSKHRPTTSPTPFMGAYSPTSSLSTANQYYWYGPGFAPTAARSDSTIRR